MKKIIISVFVFALLSLGIAFGYSLSESDELLLDRVEEQLFEVIDDDSNGISAEILIAYIEDVLENRVLSDKQSVLLEIIADDISYSYYLGAYADDIEVMLASDCYADEYYDEDDQMCYYQEDEDYDDESDYEAGDFSGAGDEDSEILAEYIISGDNITLKTGGDDIKNQEVWNIFTSLIPASVREDFSLYQVSDDANSDTAAYVVQDKNDVNMWILNVNLDAFYVEGILDPEESYATLIHEFTHVMTLGKSQMRYYPLTENQALLERFAENCTNQLLQEGCLNSDAYLDDFIDIFWADSDYLEKVRNEEVYAYDDTPKSFITEYAATNPGEDIAESFTYFVLRGSTRGTSIADKKLNFFSDYKELVSLRKQIRSRLEKLK